MIKGLKAKGRNAEVAFAKKISDSGLDPSARRMVLSGSVFGLETDIMSKLPFAFEIKNHERIRLWEFWLQTESQAYAVFGGRRAPVLVIKSNRRDFLVTMGVDDWVELVKCAINGGYGKD